MSTKSKISLEKTYVTRGGAEVKLFTIDGAIEEYPVVGMYKKPNGKWYGESWTMDGRVYTDNDLQGNDLVEAPLNLSKVQYPYLILCKNTNGNADYFATFTTVNQNHLDLYRAIFDLRTLTLHEGDGMTPEETAPTTPTPDSD